MPHPILTDHSTWRRLQARRHDAAALCQRAIEAAGEHTARVEQARAEQERQPPVRSRSPSTGS